MIVSQEGIATLTNALPDADIWCAAIDPELTDAKYIYPGLGDAGDLSYGTKKQQ